MALAEVFKALGDPVRLEIVERLTVKSPCPISSVTQGLGVSRQGARKHLQVLVDAEIIQLFPRGRDRMVHLEPAKMDAAQEFLARIERTWESRLEALKAFVEGDLE